MRAAIGAFRDSAAFRRGSGRALEGLPGWSGERDNPMLATVESSIESIHLADVDVLQAVKQQNISASSHTNNAISADTPM